MGPSLASPHRIGGAINDYNISPDVGGGNKPDTTPNMLSNVPLRWMIKELIAADTGIVFRKSEMSRYRISYAKLVEQAAAEKRQSISISLGSDSIQTVKRSEAEVMLHHHEKGITAPTAVEGDQGTDAAPEKIDLPTTPASKKDKKQTKTYKDSISPITDELVKSPAWWLLEILPFIDNKQDEHNHWINYVRYVEFFLPLLNSAASFSCARSHLLYAFVQCQFGPTSKYC